MPSPRAFRRFACLAALLLSAPLPAEQPPLDALPAKLDADQSQRLLDAVLADWAKRREKFKAVAYRLEGEDFYPKGSRNDEAISFYPPPTGDFPPADHASPFKIRAVLDFAGNRARTERTFESVGPDPAFHPGYVMVLKDGDRSMEHMPRERNPLGVPTPKVPEFYFPATSGLLTREARLLLEAHGYLTSPGRPWTTPPTADDFEVLGSVTRDGREWAVLRVLSDPPSYRRDLWIDTVLGGAVVRIVINQPDRPAHIAVIDLKDRQGFSMPDRWRWEYGHKLYTTVAVKEATFDPDLSRESFWVEPAAGQVFMKDRKKWRSEGPDRQPTPFP